MSRKRVVVLAGPTGSGESTFTNELVLAYPQFTRAVSATTRTPRPGEQEGRDYYFFSKEQFFEHVQDGSIPEHVFVRDRDAHYGTYLPDLEAKLSSEKTVIVNTDVHGARFFKQSYRATTIFIKPKSMITLYNRLVRRDPTIQKDEVIKRLLQASQEIIESDKEYDHIVFNDDGEFDDTVTAIIRILRTEGYAV